MVDPNTAMDAGFTAAEELDISADWTVSLRECGENGMTAENISMPRLKPVSFDYPNFSGEMIYRKTVALDSKPTGGVLSIQHLFEAADVFVNGRKAACRICPPYDFPLGDALTAGENVIEVRAVNTAVRNANKAPGIFGIDREILEPAGMFGNVILKLNQSQVI